jgi:hypothetical protein
LSVNFFWNETKCLKFRGKIAMQDHNKLSAKKDLRKYTGFLQENIVSLFQFMESRK